MTQMFVFSRPIKHVFADAIARFLIKSRKREQLLVSIAHQFPTQRVVKWLCFAASRQSLLTNDRERIVLLPSGPRMVVDVSDLYRNIYFYGVNYEPNTTKLVNRLLAPGDIAFDIGANAGYYSLLMAHIVTSSGQVHSFEPNPSLVRMLEQSMLLNAYTDRITVNQVAITNCSSIDTTLYLSQSTSNSGLSTLLPNKYGFENKFFSPNHTIAVSTISLDAYLSTHQIQHCSLIKIDVESAELSVIQGMKNTLENLRANYIICETRVGSDADKLLKTYAYTPYLITDSKIEKQSYDSTFWGNILYVSPAANFIL